MFLCIDFFFFLHLFLILHLQDPESMHSFPLQQQLDGQDYQDMISNASDR